MPTTIPARVPNAPILVECKTLHHVVASAAKVETGSLFHNGQMIVHIWKLLGALGHPQPPTPLKTDNSTSNSFVNKSLHQKMSKLWDMRYHWLRDRETQQHLQVFWDKGAINGVDYFTKHHPTPYHKLMWSKYILALHNIFTPVLPSFYHRTCKCVGMYLQYSRFHLHRWQTDRTESLEHK